MDEEYFSKRLTQLRLEKGVSAREMSLAIGQGPGYINNIENKRRLPSMPAFFYICEYLDVLPKDFFEYKVDSPTEMRQFMKDFQSLSKEQRTNILSLMKELLK